MQTPLASILAVTASLLLVPASAAAQGADPAFAATTLNLSAHGAVTLPPDMATLTLGVDTTGPTAAAAMRDNAGRMSAVITALKGAGVEARDIQTSNLSLAPQYVSEESKPARLTGYQASNQVSVRVTDLSRVAAVADAVVGAGANSVSGIAFGLANPAAAENGARLAAVKSLEDKAALYAQAVGYHIQRLVNLSEGGGYTPGPPRPMAMMAMRAKAPTPVEAGDLTVGIDVTGVFELGR